MKISIAYCKQDPLAVFTIGHKQATFQRRLPVVGAVTGEVRDMGSRLRRSGPLSPPLALEVITQAARALVALEAHGLVHRDLKPANLMLVEGPELTVKVIDFGLAKAAATAASESSITRGGFVGTPSFASPEQFSNTSVDVRSDLYSLGITLWACHITWH